MLKDDYMARDTDVLAKTIVRLVLGKEETDYTPTGLEADAKADGLWFALDQHIKAGDFNAAEDLLYEQAEEDDLRYLSIAVDFYMHLNSCTDQELQAGGFSREEVVDGLRDMARRFGVDLTL